MKIYLINIIAALVIAVCINVEAQTVRRIDPARLKEMTHPPLTDREGIDLIFPQPPAEHPRLFFRKSHLSEIKLKATHPLLKDCWDKVHQNSVFETDGRLEQGAVPNYNLQVIHAIEARAFMYALKGDQKMGNEAVDFIFNMHNTLNLNPKRDRYWLSVDIGRLILATSAVYDWCYDLIAPAEKKSLIDIMESLATEMEISWPRMTHGSVTGHGVENQYSRDMLACGIATWDEKPEIYNRIAGRMFSEIIPARNFTSLSGYHHQGSSYGPYRYQWEVFTTLLYDRMGYPNVTHKLHGKIPYRWIYTRRPDGQLLRDGDDFLEAASLGNYWAFPHLAYVASYYQDPLLMGEAIRQDNMGSEPLYDLLLIDPGVHADNHLESLPLTKYFAYPFGGMTARTGWDKGSTAGAVIADMKIVERQYNNHQHLDAGSFQIYYKGPLAVESGIYQGAEGGYGSEHFKNYYQRTIAHNCMLVYNPDEIFTWQGQRVANDGGQRFPGRGAEPRNVDVVMSDEYQKGEVEAYDFGPCPMKPEYSYLKGDITKAYTDKVKMHRRSFVFLNFNNAQVPAALIVYDYIISSNKDFKKTWLLHTVQEPVFNGNVCTVVRNEKGYNGKLVNTVLLPLPQNTLLEKVGGAGNEFNVSGINYPQRYRNDNNSYDGAAWRIELSPKTPSETDVFLNVIQVTDAENTGLLQITKIETEQLTGVQIGDRIVLFAKKGNPENLPVRLNIEGNGTFKVLITDLEKGNWNVTGGSEAPGMMRNDKNLVYFQAKAGNYVLSKI